MGISPRKVQVRAIDSIIHSGTPRLIKIDIEGFEWSVLQGASETIERHTPIVMVEVQANRKDIFEFFRAHDYLMFDDQMRAMEDEQDLGMNVFCFNATAHADLIRRLARGAEARAAAG